MTDRDDSSVTLTTSAQAGPGAGTATVTTLLILTLALQSAVPPFATDMYTPAFPRVTADLATSASLVGLTLTTFFLDMALGQLLGGPLSDQRGRRIPIIVGGFASVVARAVVTDWVRNGDRWTVTHVGPGGGLSRRSLARVMITSPTPARFPSHPPEGGTCRRHGQVDLSYSIGALGVSSLDREKSVGVRETDSVPAVSLTELQVGGPWPPWNALSRWPHPSQDR